MEDYLLEKLQNARDKKSQLDLIASYILLEKKKTSSSETMPTNSIISEYEKMRN